MSGEREKFTSHLDGFFSCFWAIYSDFFFFFRTEWRKLRNQFLNMQRQKMSLLKVQLRHPKYTTSYLYANKYTNPIKVDPSANEENVELKRPKTEDLRVKYEPGVILKVSFTNPIESEKLFKVLPIYICFIFYLLLLLLI